MFVVDSVRLSLVSICELVFKYLPTPFTPLIELIIYNTQIVGKISMEEVC